MNPLPGLIITTCLLALAPLRAQSPAPFPTAAPAAPCETPPALQADAIFPAALLDMTRSAADGDDTYFFQRTTELIAYLHPGDTPLNRIVSLNGFPVCLARDGSVVVALHLDYATWNPVTDRFLQAFLNPQSLTPTGFRIVLTGSVPPLLRQQLERSGIGLSDKLSPTLSR